MPPKADKSAAAAASTPEQLMPVVGNILIDQLFPRWETAAVVAELAAAAGEPLRDGA